MLERCYREVTSFYNNGDLWAGPPHRGHSKRTPTIETCKRHVCKDVRDRLQRYYNMLHDVTIRVEASPPHGGRYIYVTKVCALLPVSLSALHVRSHDSRMSYLNIGMLQMWYNGVTTVLQRCYNGVTSVTCYALRVAYQW
jgi:predicted metal-dependent RNase